jgi:hypothetical protein
VRRDPRLIAVLVVGVLVAVTWIAAATQPSPIHSVASQSSVLPVREANLVCPQAGGTLEGGAARIAYADAALTDGGSSSLTAGPLTPDGSPSAIPVRLGHSWVVDGPADASPVQIAASGPLTDSLSAVQFTRAPVGPVLQISAAACEGPTTDAWFAGFSSEIGARATLLLSNVDNVPAIVDVSIWGGDAGGPNAKRGIKVDAQTQVEVALDQIEPGLTAGVAHVVATAGRVVPALRDDAQNGSIPLGVDWLPRTAAAATTQTVPGILGGPGSRRLIVADPGDIDATFSLTVVTADGAFKPIEFDSLTVSAGSVMDVDLDPILQEAAAAIVVTSTEPVVVGGVSALPLDPTGASDFAFTAAAPALSGPTVVAGGEVSADRHTQLVLSAPAGDAQVTVSVLPSLPASTPLLSPVTVSAGTTAVFDLGALTSDPAPAVVVTPDGGGPVYAAWSLQESLKDTSAITELVLRTPVRSLLRPPARFDPATGLP